MTTGNRPDFPARRKWAAILAVIVLVLVAGGYGFYLVEEQHIRLDKYNELAAIGELKAGQIAQWRRERLDDAGVDAGSPFLRKAVEAWLKDSGNVVLRDEFLQRLKLEQRTQDVADALVLNVDGRILLAAKDDPDPVDAATMKALAQALEGKQAALSDLFRSPGGDVHLDAVAPVRDADNRPIAIVVLRSDAAKFLYPLIQSWPIPSRSAETLLVRKEGDNILFLNDLRHGAGAALSLRIPLTSTDTPAVQVVAGKQGMYEGKDYRGVEVLADLRPVPGSPWFMVAKLDASEILAEVNYRAGVIIGFVVLSILLAAFVAAFLYRQRQVRLYRALHALEWEKRKAEELLRATLIGIGDAVIAADERGCVAFMNPVAQTLTGWPQVEALGKPLSQVFHIVNAQTRERCENPVEKVLARGRVVGLANHTLLIARDGTERRIADSGAPIRDAEGSVIGVVLVFRDVTEEYWMHEALRVSHRFLEIANRHREMIPLLKESVAEARSFTRCAAAGVRMLDAEGNIPYQAYEGFSQRFYESESPLSIRSDQCMCINVIKGTTDPKLSFYTEGGSFYMNGTTRFLATVSGEEKGRTRNVCNQAGYESVALVPVRAQGRILGLIHVADPRENMVPLEVVEVLEEAAMQLGTAIQRVRAEEALRESEETHRALVEGLPDIVMRFDRDVRHLFVSDNVSEMVGFQAAQFIGKTPRELGFPEAQCRFWEEAIRGVFDSGAPFETEFTFDGKKGPVIYNWRLVPERDAQGMVRSVLSLSRDITAHRRVERDYRMLFREMLDGFALHEIICDEQGNPADCRFLAVNPAFERMTGLKAEEVLGRTVLEALPGTERYWIETYGKVALTGEPAFFENYHAGLGKHFEVRAFRPAPNQFACIFADITERKRAEDETRRLAELLDFAPSSITVHDFDGHFFYANQRTLEMHGYSRDEFLALNLHQVDAPESEALIASRMREVSEKGEARFEVAHLRKDGTTVPLEVCARMTMWGDRRVILNVGTDITERKRAEAALRVALIKYKTLFDFFPLGITVSDEVGNVLETNSNAEKLLGLPQEEHVRRAIDGPEWRIVRPDGTPMPPDEYASVRALREKRAVENVEMGIVKPDNTITWISVTAAPLPLEGHGVAVTYGDITERKRAEEALKKAEQDYRMLAENSPDLIARFDTGLRHLYVNPAAARAGKLSASEYVGLTIAECGVPEPAATTWDQRLREVLRTGKTLDAEDAFPTPEGIRYFHTRLIPERSPDGSVCSVLSVARDITKRKRAEEALRESEEKFRTLFEQAGDAIVLNDVETGKVVGFNDKAHEELEYTREEFARLAVSDIEAIESPGEVRVHIDKVVRQDGDVFESRHRTKDGRLLDVQVNAKPIVVGGQKLIQAMFRDVTERKRAEEALRESEEKFRSLFNRIPDGVYRSTHAGRFVDVNPAMVKMFGYGSREEMLALDIGKDLYFSPEEREEEFLEALQRRISVFRLRRKDGSEIWVEDRGDYVYDEQGNILFHEGILRDITERRRAEEALRESEARMRTLFENSMVGILLAAPGGRVFAANPAACRLFGRTEEDIRRIGRSGLMDSRDPRVNAFLRARTEKGYAMGEMTLVRGDGTRFPAQVASARFETEEGPRTSLVIQDLSERKLAEERIRDFSRRLLSVREEDKRRLSTVLHHDVGSFTVGVMAQLYAAEDGLRAGKSKEALASLKECRRVFSESVKRLKSLAAELRPPDLDILGLSAALRQHFLQLSRETSLRIHFSDATHGAAITPEVQTVLFRAAQECLNNVVQHAQAASARVRLTALKQGIRLSLADDGKGFDPGEVVHRPGAHLGLRALQEMAATLGGMLDIASKPGRGTKVTVTIPGRGKGEAGTGQ